MATITFHGTRGSTSYDSIDNKLFGGNSSCVSVRAGDEALILDAGTGIIDAERQLRGCATYLALSHPHHDHIEGLGCCNIAYDASRRTPILASRATLEGLALSYNGVNFPRRFSPECMPGIDFRSTRALEDGQRCSAGVFGIIAMRGNHPGGVFGYRIAVDGKTVVYATDHEFDHESREGRPVPATRPWKERYLELARGADVLIADGYCTKEEYTGRQPVDMRGWGHAYLEQVLDLAAEARVKHVVITHHMPSRTDTMLRWLEERSRSYCIQQGHAMEVTFARQGMRLEL